MKKETNMRKKKSMRSTSASQSEEHQKTTSKCVACAHTHVHIHLKEVLQSNKQNLYLQSNKVGLFNIRKDTNNQHRGRNREPNMLTMCKSKTWACTYMHTHKHIHRVVYRLNTTLGDLCRHGLNEHTRFGNNYSSSKHRQKLNVEKSNIKENSVCMTWYNKGFLQTKYNASLDIR